MKAIISTCAAAVAMLFATSASAEETSTEHLAKAAQNPLADMISVPFQNNTNFLTGKYRGTSNVTNIEPVVPFHLGEDWNLITRTIIPVIGIPRMSPTEHSFFGLGDINPTFFLSPSHPDGLIWGVGPTLSAPTATDKLLGTGKWSAGPAAVAVIMPGHWVIGLLINNMWSFAGDWDRKRVSQMTAQYFINYNMPGGWYLVSAPIVTANWVAKPGQQWTVPFGGGVGRVFRIGEQPVNAQIGAYYNAVRPHEGAKWQLRAQLSFLFPEARPKPIEVAKK
ncbi:MAG: hypothetical protein U1E28_16515 [Beijerinckiaceae bacterium]